MFMSLEGQLSRLKQLGDNWFDGKGTAPSEALLRLFEMWYNAPFEGRVCIEPNLYPTLEGGIEAEWRIERRDLTIEFDLTNQKASWHMLHLDTQEVEEFEVNIIDDQALHDLGIRTALFVSEKAPVNKREFLHIREVFFDFRG